MLMVGLIFSNLAVSRACVGMNRFVAIKFIIDPMFIRRKGKQ